MELRETASKNLFCKPFFFVPSRAGERRMRHTEEQRENIRYVCDLPLPAASPGGALDLILTRWFAGRYAQGVRSRPADLGVFRLGDRRR